MNILSSVYCLLIAIKDPPGFYFENQYFHAFPINKLICPNIDPTKDITFDLYTRNNSSEPKLLQVDNDDLLRNSGFNPSLPTIIFFHGFLESSKTIDGISIKNAYLQRKEEYNVILVNAKRLVAGPWYLTSVANCVAVGRYTALLIDYLVSRNLPLSKVHLIGHSLGAHMAGNAASNVRSGRISRLTALDPAGPLYNVIGNKEKLDTSDADFVVAIHTDMQLFGSTQSGHVNFYPNGGVGIQPGCSILDVIRRHPGVFTEKVFCSHWRSYQFYVESLLNENAFLATKCDTWANFENGKCHSNEEIKMGFSTPNSSRGNFYLKTRGNSPFSLS